jgi:NAD-dependent dihydropyrimidine dehydrogenase PreA subunit
MDREVVFSIDGWTLEHALSVPDHEPQYMSLRHACIPRKAGKPLVRFDGHSMNVTKVFVYPDSAHACWRCEEPIPESIIALYFLHEWDKL